MSDAPSSMQKSNVPKSASLCSDDLLSSGASVRIKLNDQDPDNDDDDDDFDEEMDEDVWNRKHVKYNSEQILEKQQTKSRKKACSTRTEPNDQASPCAMTDPVLSLHLFLEDNGSFCCRMTHGFHFLLLCKLRLASRLAKAMGLRLIGKMYGLH
eukprot:4242884-Amphidinium_carterae.1